MMKPDIIEEYIEKVYSYAVNRTYTRYEADELSQEILLTVIRELPKLRDDSKFEPWLWGIANNVAKSFRRLAGKNRAVYSYDVLENIPYEDCDENENEEIYDFLRTKIAMLCQDIIFDGKTEDIDSLANAIKDGYIIKRDDGSFFVTSPVLTIDQTESFNRIVETHLIPHIDKYAALVYKFVEGYKNLFPKHLHDDAARMCQNMFLGMYSVIVEYAQRTDRIKMPSKNCYCDVIQQFK